jgi:hypothetical protein
MEYQNLFTQTQVTGPASYGVNGHAITYWVA